MRNVRSMSVSTSITESRLEIWRSESPFPKLDVNAKDESLEEKPPQTPPIGTNSDVASPTQIYPDRQSESADNVGCQAGLSPQGNQSEVYLFGQTTQEYDGVEPRPYVVGVDIATVILKRLVEEEKAERDAEKAAAKIEKQEAVKGCTEGRLKVVIDARQNGQKEVAGKEKGERGGESKVASPTDLRSPSDVGGTHTPSEGGCKGKYDVKGESDRRITLQNDGWKDSRPKTSPSGESVSSKIPPKPVKIGCFTCCSMM